MRSSVTKILSFFQVGNMDIFLIDGIGPFFRNYSKRQVNWSKIPFHCFPIGEEELTRYFDTIVEDVALFAGQISKLGYNSITFDDVVHLTPDIWLEPEVNHQIKLYIKQFQRVFDVCKKFDLDIYLTMDIMSLTPELAQKIGSSTSKALIYLARLVDTTLSLHPDIKGIIMRIGECDGKDVKGIFRSELLLKTPKQVNRMLMRLLPVFEQYDRTLILRTWTVGAYPVGDFIWHRETCSDILNNIESKNFILSLKYGETDFFRYLPLNRHFFRTKVRKIIEFQARREYEGCGEYPSFIGWDLYDYYQQLQNAENMAGISVWCQTGGWVPFRRLTYLEKRGIWNELNSYACIKIFKEGKTVEAIAHDFSRRIGYDAPDTIIEFLKINDEVIKTLLYIQPFAEQKLFFRRVRIPPLLSVYWNNVFINHAVRKVLLAHVDDKAHCIDQGQKALKKIERMKEIAAEAGLPVEDIQYMYDTFAILQLAREYYFLPFDETRRQRIKKAKKEYKKRYPKQIRPRYRIKTNFEPMRIKSRHLKWLMHILLRRKRGYRVIDRLLTLYLMGFMYKLFIKARPKMIPKFARKHAMGIETIFK